MRHGSSSRRQRNRNGGGRRSGNNRSQVFDSNGPDVRIRGTAHQVCEKYLTLAKDSKSAGDHVLAESYLQHAEHYQRIINDFDADSPKQNRAQNNDDQGEQEADGNKAQGRSAQKKSSKAKNDDLGLPGSILGEDSSAKAEATADA